MTRTMAYVGAAACLLLFAGGEARAGSRFAAMGGDGGGSHGSIDLIVRQVTVTPVVAHVGDRVRVDAVIENHGEGYGTITARVYANGKSVASHLLTYDTGHGPNALYHESFVWNTAGARPGEYRIRAEAFDWNDSSPFDNSMDVKEPVTLLPAGAPFPAGMKGGGEAVAVDPRWHPRRAAPGPRSGNSSAAPGIERETASGRPQ